MEGVTVPIMNIMAALLLDCILGDPKGLPHPVIYVGRIISFWESIFYPVSNGKKSGLIFCISVLITVGAAVSLVLCIAGMSGKYIKGAVEIYLLYAAIAFKSLKDESAPVAAALLKRDITAAQKSLSHIVGRDTEKLDEKSIVRAAVETIAEGYVDGIVSVLFYMFVGSFFTCQVLFAWLFKAASTMDSMVGYENERYNDFGWAAAKLDDFLNFLPARLGGVIAVIGGGIAGFDWKRAIKIFLRDRKKHKSPNSAHGESAFAGLLGISLGGGAYYDGEFEARQVLGDGLRDPVHDDIFRAHKILNYSVAVCALIIFAGEAFSI